MAESQDVNTLKRRGRRRLVGAIALVLLAVIVLPWIFDQQPRQTPPVSVRIPSQDETPFTPKPVPKPAPVEAAKPATAPVPAPAKPEAAKPAPAAERARAEAALANAQFTIQVGAYTDPASVVGKLKAAKLAYYTEPVATAKGTVTRVRAGPYASREAAEKALKQLKGLGFTQGVITERP
jgi:DedD protein